MEDFNRGYFKTKYFNYYAMVLIYIIVLLPFLSLSGVRDLLGESAYSVYQSAAMVLLGVLAIFKVRHMPKDPFPFIYLIFHILVFLVTTRHYGFSMGILVVCFAGFFIVLLIQRDAALMIKALSVVAVVALVANFLSMVKLGVTERAEYFIGGKNHISIFLIPATFTVMMDSHLQRQKITWFVFLYAAVASAMVFLAGSATGIITAIAMIVGVLWIRKFKPNVAVMMIGMIVIQVVLVFFVGMLSNSPLWIRILNLLGKDETLTSRAIIWEQSINIIRNNLFLGVGRGAGIRYTSNWGYTRITSEAHNFFLEYLLEGGIVGLVLYGTLLWLAVRKLNMDVKLHRIIFICFMVMLVNGLAEAVNNKMYVSIVLALLNACSNNTIGSNRLRRQTEGKAST